MALGPHILTSSQMFSRLPGHNSFNNHFIIWAPLFHRPPFFSQLASYEVVGIFFGQRLSSRDSVMCFSKRTVRARQLTIRKDFLRATIQVVSNWNEYHSLYAFLLVKNVQDLKRKLNKNLVQNSLKCQLIANFLFSGILLCWCGSHVVRSSFHSRHRRGISHNAVRKCVVLPTHEVTGLTRATANQPGLKNVDV